jgi:beta-glucosidase
LREKVDLLTGADAWHTAGVPRLGIGAMEVTDGPNGVTAWSRWGAGGQARATALPTGICLGATFDVELARAYGRVLGEEALAYGYDIVLGPCMNIVRAPLGGRNFETFGEDPQINGRIGTAYVLGAQAAGCGTSVKHFCCNNQEHERMRGDSVVDGRTLREIYLPHFEMAVREARPWTVMCSYNRVNGVYASENALLLKKILREEWGFDGLVVSDWGAVHSIAEAVTGGTDLEMPGPARYRGDLLLAAAQNWQIGQADLDEAVAHVLTILDRAGKLGGMPLAAGSKDTPDHHAVALRAAREGMVLLKNEGHALPFEPGSLKRLAVIGRNADALRYGGGGSSAALPTRVVQPLQALREALPDTELVVVPGPMNMDQPPVLDAQAGAPIEADGKPGFVVEVFDGDSFDGEPTVRTTSSSAAIRTRSEQRPFGLSNGRRYCVRWKTRFTPACSGAHRFVLRNSGFARLLLDGKPVIEHRSSVEHYNASMESLDLTLPFEQTDVRLDAGQGVEIAIEFVKPAIEDIGWMRAYASAVADLRGEADTAAAVDAALSCDAALIVAGMPAGFEAEGRDRPHMRLPGGQDGLIAAVAAAQPRTAVVLNVGSPVEMPWIDRVPAVLLAWFPGQEGGRAIADLVLGRANPCGHLPVTFPRRIEDNPTFGTYPGSRRVHYGEGIFVGYRWYDARGIVPLFAFGHGLSYTSFALESAEAPARVAAGEAATVACTVVNTGDRAGAAVVQAYVHDEVCPHPRPPQELKAFAKVRLEPGERRRVEFRLEARAFSYVDPDTLRWRADAGRFRVRFGLSSRDIRLESELELV